mgnify:FL=1
MHKGREGLLSGMQSLYLQGETNSHTPSAFPDLQCWCPLEREALHLLVLLPESDHGNKYILIVGDYFFSKWTEAHTIASYNMPCWVITTQL